MTSTMIAIYRQIAAGIVVSAIVVFRLVDACSLLQIVH